MNKLLIIDGNSLVNRAFYALPLLSNDKGEYSNAVYGFTNILIKAINEIQPSHIAVAFDVSRKTFRNTIFADYKANRKGMPEELRMQMPILKRLLNAMNVKIFEIQNVEADDVIGTISKKHAGETIILSGDKDVLQLVNNNVSVLLTKKGISEVEFANTQWLKDYMGISPNQIIDLKALMGDVSDNIPGVSGIGEVTAKKLVNEYGTLDNIYSNINNISEKLKNKLQEGKDSAYLSYNLATIKTDCDLEFDISQCEYDFPFNDEVKNIFKEYNFKTLLNRFEIFKNESVFIKEDKQNAIKKVLVKTEKQLKDILKTQSINYLAFNFIGEICFSFNADAVYFVNENDIFDNIDLTLEKVLLNLQKLFLDENILKIVYDYKSHIYINKMLYDIKGEVFDLSIASYLVNAGLKVLPNKDVSLFFADMENKKQEMESLGVNKVFYDIEMPLIKVLFDMEQSGFCVDEKMVTLLSDMYRQEIKEITQKIYELCEMEFNINSPKQVSAVLFDSLGISDKQNKKRSTNFDSLSEIEHLHPVVSLILRYRRIQKLSSTYIEVYKSFIEKNGNTLHTVFNQTLTSTGRLSSSEPNLQNIPTRNEEGKLLRKMFVSRFENGQLVTADYNQIELRLLANFSADKNMTYGYLHDADIHRATASLLFGQPKEKISSSQRRAAKAVNFGVVYGISAFGLSKNTGFTQKEAKKFIEKYYETYPGVDIYMKKNVEQAIKNGYSKTMFGRIRKIPELASSNRMIKMFGERVAMNMPLQGSASDIIKIAMIKVHHAIKKQNLKSKLILQIHDELIIDTHPDELMQIKTILKQCMEGVVNLSVPLLVEIESGKTWFDAK